MEYTINDVRLEASREQQKKKHVQRIQLIVFKLGSEEYALPIAQVKEVVITPRIAKMPQTPDYIKGVANIRGSIIAIMDLEQRFGLQTADNHIGNYTLVLESEQFKVGFLVKEVPNTLTVPVDEIDAAADFIQYSNLNTDFFVGVVKSEQRMIILLDMLKLVAVEKLKSE